MDWSTLASQIVEWADKIPATFWGVVIGSWFSLSGVILSNRSSEKRQAQQFDHERKLKNQDREISLKKDIYIEAAAAVAENLQAIVALANLEVPANQALEKINKNSGSIAKIQVIGSEATLRTLAAFMSTFNTVLFQLSPMRVTLDLKRQELQALQVHVEAHMQEHGRWLEVQKQYNFEQQTDRAKWGAISRNSDIVKGLYEDAAAKVATAAHALHDDRMEFLRQCAEASFKCVELLPPLVVALRTELGIPIDPSALKELMGASVSVNRDGIADMQKGILNAIKEAGTRQKPG